MEPTRRLLALCLASLSFAQGSGAQERSVLIGSVVDEVGSPVSGVAVRLLGTDLSTTTSDQGTFTLGKVGAANYQIMIRRLGFVAEVYPVSVYRADTSSVALQMEHLAQPLSVVRVERDKNTKAALAGFYERRRSGIAPQSQFITRDDIEKRNPGRLSEMMDRMSVRAKGCTYGNIFVDGISLGASDGVRRRYEELGIKRGALDQFRPDEVEAIEVYASSTQVPAKYALTGAPDTPPGCAILIWTR